MLNGNRKSKPENVTAEEMIQKFKLLMHFQGSGNASEKEYQEIDDVRDGWEMTSRSGGRGSEQD